MNLIKQVLDFNRGSDLYIKVKRETNYNEYYKMFDFKYCSLDQFLIDSEIDYITRLDLSNVYHLFGFNVVSYLAMDNYNNKLLVWVYVPNKVFKHIKSKLKERSG